MENISVFVRVRPFTDSEQNADVASAVQVVSNNQIIVQPSFSSLNCSELRFSFKEVFDKNAKHSDVCGTISSFIIADVLQGYNCTLFAYGATGSGKAYVLDGRCQNTPATKSSISSLSTRFQPNAMENTMDTFSNQSSSADSVSIMSMRSIQLNEIANIAIMPSTIDSLFENLNRIDGQFTTRITYLEIFNEELFDLLQPIDTPTIPLKIYENVRNSVHVSGLTEKVVTNAAEAHEALQMGTRRVKGGTHKSKSHSIFTVLVYIKEHSKPDSIDNEEISKFCKLHLVQLASSENFINEKQMRAKTTQSLASFSRVVQALIDKQSHIPYRDSKLTRILQESLGGNSKTSIISTVAPGINFIEETIQTLEFMTRVKNVCNRPVINERLSKALMLNDIANQIKQLKLDIEANRTKTGKFLSDEEYNDCQNQLGTTHLELRRNFAEIKLLNEQYAHIENVFSDLQCTLHQKNRQISDLHKETTSKKHATVKISDAVTNCELNIDRHNHTEKLLTEQALELTKTAHEITADHTNLRESIRRRKMADDYLKIASTKFMDEMKVHFENMMQHTHTNSTAMEKIIKTSKINQDKFHRMSISMLELLKSKTNSLQQTVEIRRIGKANQIDEAVSNVMADLSKNVSLPASTNFQSNTEILKVFTETMEKSFQHKELVDKLLKEMASRQSDMLSRFVEKISNKTKQFYDSLAREINSLRLSLDQSVKMNERLNDHMSKIISHIEIMVNNLVGSNTKLCSVMPSLLTVEQSLETSKVQAISQLETFGNEMNRLQLAPLSEIHTEDLKLKMTDIEKSREGTDQLATKLDAISALGARTYDTFNNKLENFGTSLLSGCNMLASSEALKCLEKTLNKQSTSVLEQNEEDLAIVRDIVSTNDRFSKEHQKEISSSRKEMQFFRDINYCQYSSSGETPSKRDYKTNISLAATTPHDKIKQRFREKIMQNGGASPLANNFSFLDQ